MGTNLATTDFKMQCGEGSAAQPGISLQTVPQEIVMANIRSVLSKRDELKNMILLRKPAAVALTETLLSADVADAEVGVAGYTLFRCDRVGRIGGVPFCMSVKTLVQALCTSQLIQIANTRVCGAK